MFSSPDLSYTESRPRALRWRLHVIPDSLQSVRERLDRLQSSDVCWEPYVDHRVEHPFHDIAWYSGCIKCELLFTGTVTCYTIVAPHHTAAAVAPHHNLLILLLLHTAVVVPHEYNFSSLLIIFVAAVHHPRCSCHLHHFICSYWIDIYLTILGIYLLHFDHGNKCSSSFPRHFCRYSCSSAHCITLGIGRNSTNHYYTTSSYSPYLC